MTHRKSEQFTDREGKNIFICAYMYVVWDRTTRSARFDLLSVVSRSAAAKIIRDSINKDAISCSCTVANSNRMRLYTCIIAIPVLDLT